MKPIINLAQIFTLSFSLIIIGCSHNNVFEIDKVEGGATETITGLEGLYRSGTKNLNVIFIHGMGYHPIVEEAEQENGVTRRYQNRLAEDLGFSKDSEQQILVPKDSLRLKQSEIIGGYLYWRKFEDNKGRILNLFALSWDEVTVTIQKSMFELDENFYERNGSEDGDREKDRAVLNRQLKRFINRSFSDPAIYLGSFGKEIRYIVAQGIAKIDAILMKNNYLDDPKYNQIVHISDSLGSSVIFDTVKESMSSIDKSSELFVYKESVERFAGLSKQIFMNANQLPLIELGQLEGPTSNEDEKQWLDNYPCPKSPKMSGLLKFVETRNSYIDKHLKSKLGGQIPELQLVAFTDPNDALSYYLTKRFKNRCSGNKIHIVNVMLTNARWNYLFVLANPGKAHASGFKENKKAIDIIVNGVN